MICEDRDRFNKLIKELKIHQPKSDIVYSFSEAKKSTKKIDFPIVVRPSYVLGVRAMRIVNNELELKNYFSSNFTKNGKAILIGSIFVGAKEIDVDAISDGKNIFIAGILEHIEEAGAQLGDFSMLSHQTIPKALINEIKRLTNTISQKLKNC